MLSYDDYKARFLLIEELFNVIMDLKERNKKCIEPDFSERHAMIFLEKAAKRYNNIPGADTQKGDLK